MGQAGRAEVARGTDPGTPRLGRRAKFALTAGGVAAAAAVAGIALLPAGSAAATPKAHYHAGSDTATFTVTGVLDHNCLVSVGGDEIWIKPGDRIRFGSSLAGVSVSDALAGKTLGGLLNQVLTPSQVAGLNVTARIYSGHSSQKITVAGGKHTSFSDSGRHRLSAGDHKIVWKATGLALLPGLTKTSVPLSSSDLKSGASLSWKGVIHVTSSAPKCKLGISTPSVGASIGPVKVHVPQHTIHAPGSEPTHGIGGGQGTGSGGHSGGSHPGPGQSSAPPHGAGATSNPGGISIPARVVPQGSGAGDYGSGGGGLSLLPNTGSGSGGGGGLHLDRNGGSSSGGGTNDAVAGLSKGDKRQVELAASQPHPSSSWAVLLAVLAVIALAIVAGVYARIYLLGRKPTA